MGDILEGEEKEQFINYLIAERNRWILETVTKFKAGLIKLKTRPEPELDEKIVKNYKFIQSKIPPCKSCPFTPFGIEDPQRFILFVETQIDPLLLLFCPKENLPYVLPENGIYPEPKKVVVIACPNFSCGIAHFPGDSLYEKIREIKERNEE